MTGITNGLWKAADVLSEKGFGKGHLQNNGGNVCALGAYNLAYGRHANADGNGGSQNWADANHADEMKAVAETIRSLFPDRYTGTTHANALMNFNDNEKTTQEDLAKVFRVAAVKLAAGI